LGPGHDRDVWFRLGLVVERDRGLTADDPSRRQNTLQKAIDVPDRARVTGPLGLGDK